MVDEVFPSDAFTRTKKSILYLSGFEELYWQTGLYLDLFAIPPSSKEHCLPRMNERLACAFNDSIDACN